MLVHHWSPPTASLASDGSPIAQLRLFAAKAGEGNLMGEHASIVIKGLQAEGMIMELWSTTEDSTWYS
jgi:hypothetical protein